MEQRQVDPWDSTMTEACTWRLTTSHPHRKGAEEKSRLEVSHRITILRPTCPVAYFLQLGPHIPVTPGLPRVHILETKPKHSNA